MGVPAASRGYFGSTLPRASSVANSSSSTSLSTRSRILACNADLGIARIWKASATESSGGTPLGEESIKCRSDKVCAIEVRGERNDQNRLENLCQRITLPDHDGPTPCLFPRPILGRGRPT